MASVTVAGVAPEIEVDVILVGAAPADRVCLGGGNFAHRKKRLLLIDYERIECRKWDFEKGGLNVVDEHRGFAGIVDQWSDRGCVREGALHARQERTCNIVVGEKIEIDGYAVTNLERKL